MDSTTLLNDEQNKARVAAIRKEIDAERRRMFSALSDWVQSENEYMLETLRAALDRRHEATMEVAEVVLDQNERQYTDRLLDGALDPPNDPESRGECLPGHTLWMQAGLRDALREVESEAFIEIREHLEELVTQIWRQTIERDDVVSGF